MILAISLVACIHSSLGFIPGQGNDYSFSGRISKVLHATANYRPIGEGGASLSVVGTTNHFQLILRSKSTSEVMRITATFRSGQLLSIDDVSIKSPDLADSRVKGNLTTAFSEWIKTRNLTLNYARKGVLIGCQESPDHNYQVFIQYPSSRMPNLFGSIVNKDGKVVTEIPAM